MDSNGFQTKESFLEKLKEERTSLDETSIAARLVDRELERVDKGGDPSGHENIHSTRPIKFIVRVQIPPDNSREAELLASGDPKYTHLKEPLHVRVEALAPVPEAYRRVAIAMNEIRKSFTAEMGNPEMGQGGPMGQRGGRGRGGPRGRGPPRGGRGGPRGGPRGGRGGPPRQSYGAPQEDPYAAGGYEEDYSPAGGYAQGGGGGYGGASYGGGGGGYGQQDYSAGGYGDASGYGEEMTSFGAAPPARGRGGRGGRGGGRGESRFAPY